MPVSNGTGADATLWKRHATVSAVCSWVYVQRATGEWVTSDFVPMLAVGDPQDGKGYVALGPVSKISTGGR